MKIKNVSDGQGALSEETAPWNPAKTFVYFWKSGMGTGENSLPISCIQSRLGDVEKGWLSIDQLQDLDGALSLDNQAGEGALSPGEEKNEPN